MPRVEINGIRLHYQQMGSGPDIVLVHGLFSNIGFWWSVIAPALARKYRVTALDLRGHGLSGMTEHGYRAIDLAEDVVLLMAHLDVRNVHLIGHSFGGAIGLAAALQCSEAIQKITLADAWVPALQPQIDMPNARAWPALKKSLRARGIEDVEDLPMVAMAFLQELAETPDPAFAPMSKGQDRAAWMPVNRESRGVRQWRRLMTTSHAWKEFYKTDQLDAHCLSHLETPVELIYGARSGYLKTRDKLLQTLPNVSWREVPGGHYFPIIHPKALTDVVLGTASPPQSITQDGHAV